jgi:hypothetical protein
MKTSHCDWVPESPRVGLPKTSKQLLPAFTPSIPGKLEVTEKNGYDIWIQHRSITQERILWFLQLN